MKNHFLFKSQNLFFPQRLIFFEAPHPSEAAESQPQGREERETIDPRQKTVDAMKANGLENARVEIEQGQRWKNERTQPGVPRDMLPASHPDNEKITVDTPVYHFSYRGTESNFRIIKQESGNVILGFSTEKFGSAIQAQNLNSAISKIRQKIENNDPNYISDLMRQSGFKNVAFREKGQGGYPTYDFTLKNGLKGNIVKVSERNGFLLACNLEGQNSFTVNAPTLTESISKLMDEIDLRSSR